MVHQILVIVVIYITMFKTQMALSSLFKNIKNVLKLIYDNLFTRDPVNYSTMYVCSLLWPTDWRMTVRNSTPRCIMCAYITMFNTQIINTYHKSYIYIYTYFIPHVLREIPHLLRFINYEIVLQLAKHKFLTFKQHMWIFAAHVDFIYIYFLTHLFCSNFINCWNTTAYLKEVN